MTHKREERAILASLKWTGSLIIWIGSFIANILVLMFPMTWLEFYFRCRKKQFPLILRELWIIILIFIQILILIYGKPTQFLLLFVGVFGLLDVLSATFRDLIISLRCHKDKEGPYIRIQDPLRWILMTSLNALQIVLCFAILLLYYGNQFDPHIRDPLTALYQSALTFTTLGYGDIKPSCGIGRIIICSELAFFFVFLAIKLPIAVSVIRVKVVSKN